MKFSALPAVNDWGGFWNYEVPKSSVEKDGACRGLWGVPCIAADQAPRCCSCQLTGNRARWARQGQMRWNGQFSAES